MMYVSRDSRENSTPELMESLYKNDKLKKNKKIDKMEKKKFEAYSGMKICQQWRYP